MRKFSAKYLQPEPKNTIKQQQKRLSSRLHLGDPGKHM